MCVCVNPLKRQLLSCDYLLKGVITDDLFYVLKAFLPQFFIERKMSFHSMLSNHIINIMYFCAFKLPIDLPSFLLSVLPLSTPSPCTDVCSCSCPFSHTWRPEVAVFLSCLFILLFCEMVFQLLTDLARLSGQPALGICLCVLQIQTQPFMFAQQALSPPSHPSSADVCLFLGRTLVQRKRAENSADRLPIYHL